MEQELSFIEKINDHTLKINQGFVPNMKVPGYVYVNDSLQPLLFDELKAYHESNKNGFLPALKQIANVASLPGIVGGSIGLPDIHSGYGFAIGNIAAFDMSDPEAVVSPGGVGFDINCGVRLLRTNLKEADLLPLKETLTQTLFDTIPVGVGQKGSFTFTDEQLKELLLKGMGYCLQEGLAWPEDVEMCEEKGCMTTASLEGVSQRALKRGQSQIGTLGAGNHYLEVQVVDEIYHESACHVMGIEKGTVCVMIHSGSRGFGHQVATDALSEMEQYMTSHGIELNDKQLACAPIQSEAGKKYIGAMSCAANYAWANRQVMTYLTRQCFAQVFKKSAKDLEMYLVYDTCHNIAKIEEHLHPQTQQLTSMLVHRKGSTRAFPPGHQDLPQKYKEIGQPVLIGGTMGTYSYVMLGTQTGMLSTFGSTCHGAGRSLGRHKAKKLLKPEDVFTYLKEKNISIRVASPNLVVEEAPESYKDVGEVIDTCHVAGISHKAFRLKPVAVIKG